MTSSSAVALCAAAILAASMVGTALGQSECAMYRQKSQCEGVSGAFRHAALSRTQQQQMLETLLLVHCTRLWRRGCGP